MRARRQPNEVISALQAFVFAVALALALTFVLAPVLPGQTHLDVGEAAPKTFEAGGQVIVHEGDVVTQAEVSRIRDEGLLSNRISVSGVFAATILFGTEDQPNGSHLVDGCAPTSSTACSSVLSAAANVIECYLISRCLLLCFSRTAFHCLHEIPAQTARGHQPEPCGPTCTKESDSISAGQGFGDPQVLSGQSTPRPQADPDEPQGIQQ